MSRRAVDRRYRHRPSLGEEVPAPIQWEPTSIRLIHSGVHAETMTSIGVGKNPAAGLFCCGQFDSTAMTGISALSIT